MYYQMPHPSITRSRYFAEFSSLTFVLLFNHLNDLFHNSINHSIYMPSTLGCCNTVDKWNLLKPSVWGGNCHLPSRIYILVDNFHWISIFILSVCVQLDIILEVLHWELFTIEEDLKIETQREFSSGSVVLLHLPLPYKKKKSTS